jgi:hypothetical protein
MYVLKRIFRNLQIPHLIHTITGVASVLHIIDVNTLDIYVVQHLEDLAK